MSLYTLLTMNYNIVKHNILGITLDNIPKLKTLVNSINNRYPTKILLWLSPSTPVDIEEEEY